MRAREFCSASPSPSSATGANRFEAVRHAERRGDLQSVAEAAAFQSHQAGS
jgi:hypothetical protein